MPLTRSDVAKESAKYRTESLIAQVRAGLESMRERLEGGLVLTGMEARDALLPVLIELAELLGEPLRSPAFRETDPDGLQDFRRNAWRDLEALQASYASHCATDWRSGADEARRLLVRGTVRRFGIPLGIVAALLAGWWAWQRTSQERAGVALELAKTRTAAEGARLIGFAAGLAARTQGKPLSGIVQDMSGACRAVSGQGCRDAWAAAREALFGAVVPEPGKPVKAPSEVYADPWGNPYVLLIPEEGPARVVSAGPDGKLGTADDVGVDIPSWNSGTGSEGGSGVGSRTP